MKKTFLFVLVILAAGAAFGQEFTFQGLPWGSTREQVIEKLGQPGHHYGDSLFYTVSINGYKAWLDIGFNANRMSQAFYTIGRFRDLGRVHTTQKDNDRGEKNRA
ncbi:MAG: hypothetical protein LBH43_08485 [Treponema sp.]|jgi:outer membrane protein assembly factor BamE (lipoprotein component of BamABCDE complex)|nr:hypothetical protein [Treponema sp.]